MAKPKSARNGKKAEFSRVFFELVVLLLGDPWGCAEEMKERFGVKP